MLLINKGNSKIHDERKHFTRRTAPPARAMPGGMGVRTPRYMKISKISLCQALQENLLKQPSPELTKADLHEYAPHPPYTNKILM